MYKRLLATLLTMVAQSAALAEDFAEFKGRDL